MTLSICLTVHNKKYLLEKVLLGILKNTVSEFEIVFFLDNCTDGSPEELRRLIIEGKAENDFRNLQKLKILYGEKEDLFETKSNNVCLAKCEGKYCCIIQDDQIITEHAWDKRLMLPFEQYNDVFAVTARTAHNWRYNKNSTDINEQETNLNRWSDVLVHYDHADKNNTVRDVFYIRQCVNRGPLMILRDDLVKLNYLDEVYFPQGFDEHDLCMRAKKELGKVCGFFDIAWHTEPHWGGTRDENGNTKTWMLNADQKNAKIFYSRWKNELQNINESRKIII